MEAAIGRWLGNWEAGWEGEEGTLPAPHIQVSLGVWVKVPGVPPNPKPGYHAEEQGQCAIFYKDTFQLP